MKRAIIIVLDSVGIGELPDAADFGFFYPFAVGKCPATNV